MKTLEFSFSGKENGTVSRPPFVLHLALELVATLADELVIVALAGVGPVEPGHASLVVDRAWLLRLLLLALDSSHNLLGLLRSVRVTVDGEGVNHTWHPEEQAQKHVEDGRDWPPTQQDCERWANDAEECSHDSSTAGSSIPFSTSYPRTSVRSSMSQCF